MLNIGSLRVNHPFVQAALSGYSDLPMRRIARMHGATYAVNEVVLDRSVLHASDWQRRLLAVESDDHPVGAQLMGSQPKHFGPAARRLVDAGYDVIDINFGCPARSVLNRCRGGFLLGDPATATRIVRSVIDAVGGDRPVTLKMRRGVDDTLMSERAFFAILDDSFDNGLSAVTVHGRTVQQRYVGASNWHFLHRVKRHLGTKTVLGSGDLFTAEDCIRMMRETGVDGVTIARGALGNPWIFRDCLALASGQDPPPPPSIVDQRRTIETHLAEIIKVYGEGLAAKIIVKFMLKYGRHHPKPRRLREAFLKVKSLDTFCDVMALWYRTTPRLSSLYPATERIGLPRFPDGIDR